jgi:hypothetical protein
LRDYGTPQISGGDPDCRHRWGAERRIRRGGGTGSSGLGARRGKRRVIAVETLSKSGLSMGVPLVERLTSLSNS